MKRFALLLILAVIGLIFKRRKAAAETEAPLMDTASGDLESFADDIAAEGAAEAEEVVVDSLAGDFRTPVIFRTHGLEKLIAAEYQFSGQGHQLIQQTDVHP